MTVLKDVLDSGNTNTVGPAAHAARLGSRLHAGGVRLQRETLAVASAAATPGFTCLHLLHCKTTGTGAAGEKACDINGATPGTGHAAPNAGGTSIVFNAEETGTGTVDIVYLTGDPPKDADGVAATALTASVSGIS